MPRPPSTPPTDAIDVDDAVDSLSKIISHRPTARCEPLDRVATSALTDQEEVLHSRLKAYPAFKQRYAEGLRAIRASIEEGCTPDKTEKVGNGAIEALLDTDYGQGLKRDSNLGVHLERLEAGYETLRTTLEADRSPEAKALCAKVDWARLDEAELERGIRYWAEMGRIFHYFRDVGGSLNTRQVERMQETFREHVTTITNGIESMLDHVTIRFVYRDRFVGRLERILDEFKQADAEARHKRVALAADGGPNVFQGGDTRIRRQFVRMVSLLGFELFAHMPTAHIQDLLELKSDTADALDLVAWPLTVRGGKPMSDDSCAREIRGYREQALKTAKTLARLNSFPTEWLIHYAEQHPDVVDRDLSHDCG